MKPVVERRVSLVAQSESQKPSRPMRLQLFLLYSILKAEVEAGVADQILHEMVECSVMRRSRRSCRCTKKGQLRYSMSYIESYPCHCRCKLECSHHRAVMRLQSKIWSNRRILSAEIVPGFNGCIGVNFGLRDFLANVSYYSIASLMYWSK